MFPHHPSQRELPGSLQSLLLQRFLGLFIPGFPLRSLPPDFVGGKHLDHINTIVGTVASLNYLLLSHDFGFVFKLLQLLHLLSLDLLSFLYISGAENLHSPSYLGFVFHDFVGMPLLHPEDSQLDFQLRLGQLLLKVAD